MNKKEKILLDNSRTFVLKFSDMKKSKNEILRSKFGDNKSLIYSAPSSHMKLVLRLRLVIDELSFKPLTIFSVPAVLRLI
jgi:hypothetical protein